MVCCRWSGRNNRGKIGVHVEFEEELDLRDFCTADLGGSEVKAGSGGVSSSYVYQLSAVVMHHGRGFGSGHYTAYCWNTEASESDFSLCVAIVIVNGGLCGGLLFSSDNYNYLNKCCSCFTTMN